MDLFTTTTPQRFHTLAVSSGISLPFATLSRATTYQRPIGLARANIAQGLDTNITTLTPIHVKAQGFNLGK